MIRNFFKMVIRFIVKNKAFSFINIVGLGLGSSVSLLLGILIRDANAGDNFHNKHDRVLQVYTDALCKNREIIPYEYSGNKHAQFIKLETLTDLKITMEP
jgi:hypothetical protein